MKYHCTELCGRQGENDLVESFSSTSPSSFSLIVRLTLAYRGTQRMFPVDEQILEPPSIF